MHPSTHPQPISIATPTPPPPPLQATLSALQPAMRAHCVATLCAAPSPELSALLLQRLRQELAGAAGLLLRQRPGALQAGSEGPGARAGVLAVPMAVLAMHACMQRRPIWAKGTGAA